MVRWLGWNEGERRRCAERRLFVKEAAAHAEITEEQTNKNGASANAPFLFVFW